MKRKLLLPVLTLLIALCGCGEKKHNLDENFRYDETSHWKWCYDEECFKANKKFEEGEHNLVLNGEPEVIKIIGRKDRIKTLYKCDVCEYQKTDYTEDADGLIYGTFEYPATPSDMPDSYVSPNDKIKLEIISFPSTSQSYVCYVDVENDGYIYDEKKVAGYDPAKNKKAEVYPIPVKFWHCIDDHVVSYEITKKFVDTIKENGGIACLRAFPHGGHEPQLVGEIIKNPCGISIFQGNPIEISDPLLPVIQKAVQSSAEGKARVQSLLAIKAIFGDDLPDNSLFTAKVTEAYLSSFPTY